MFGTQYNFCVLRVAGFVQDVKCANMGLSENEKQVQKTMLSLHFHNSDTCIQFFFYHSVFKLYRSQQLFIHRWRMLHTW